MTSAVLQLDGMMVPLETAGPSRKARLTIERDGSLTLRAAADVQRDELEQFLAAKRSWIYKKLAEKETLHYEPVTKELVDGEGFLYLGRSHRLLISNDDGRHVTLQRGRLVLPATLLGDGEGALIRWYRTRGKAWLQPRVSAWAERLRVRINAFEVAELGYRWGAAEPSGRVRINWATMQLPPALVEHVVAHELAHLEEPHHGPAFWRLLGRAQPDFADRRAELARVGAGVWLGNGH